MALARVFLPTATPNRAGTILLLPRFLAPRGGDAIAMISTTARTSPARQQGLCRPQESSTRQGICQHGVRSRLFSTTAAAAAIRSRNNYNLPKGKPPLPRDKEIKHRYVYIRKPDGSLSQPLPTAEVLSRLNRHTQSLVVLALPKEAEEEGDEEVEDGKKEGGDEGGGNCLEFPICHIVDRIAERKAESDKLRELRKKAVSFKALELNWSIESHDLEHRLAKLREFLEKGLRVEVTLLRRGKGRNKKQQATLEHAASVVKRVRAVVAEVPGAREVKKADGELLQTMKLLVEGPAKKAEKKDKTKEGEAEAGESGSADA